jgi:glycerol-3-phosphate acyltransferase PlsY
MTYLNGELVYSKLMDINLIIVAVYSYLLGSIPFGLVLTKIFLKKDIRK